MSGVGNSGVTYRIGSSGLVYAPGIVAWAINGYAFEDDRPALLRVVSGTWSGIPVDIWERILTGQLEYQVDGETVVVTVQTEGPDGPSMDP